MSERLLELQAADESQGAELPASADGTPPPAAAAAAGLQRSPGGIGLEMCEQLLDTMNDIVKQSKLGVRCAPPTADDFVYVERLATRQRCFMFCGLHRMQLVCKDRASGQWMVSEVPGANYEDSSTVLCCSLNGVWDDKDLQDTLSGMAQLLHWANTGKSVAGDSAQERQEWHAQVLAGHAVANCPSVVDEALKDLVELHLLPLGQAGGSAGTWLRHVAANRYSTTLGGELLVGAGSITSTNFTDPEKDSVKLGLRRALNDVGRTYMGDASTTKAQLEPGLTAVLSCREPDRGPAAGFSRGDRDWDYSSLSMLTEACRNLDAHPDKATSLCIAPIWSAVLRPDRQPPPPAKESTELADGNPVIELLTLVIAPRLTRAYALFAESGQESPILLPASFCAGMFTAVQRLIRTTPGLLTLFGATAGRLVRLQSLPQAPWFKTLEGPGKQHAALEARVLSALAIVPAAAPSPSRPVQSSFTYNQLLLGSGSGDGGSSDSGSDGSSGGSSRDGSSGGGASDATLLKLQQGQNGTHPYGIQFLPGRGEPPLSCHGNGFDLTTPTTLRTRGQHEAVLPGPVIILKLSTLLLGSRVAQVGSGYAQQPCYGLLYGAAAQHVAGSILPRLVLAQVHLVLAAGLHPGTDSSSEGCQRMGFAVRALMAAYPDLELPEVLTEQERDLLAAHTIWWTWTTMGCEEAAKLKVARVGAGWASAAWMFCDAMKDETPLAALQHLQAMTGPLHHFWVPRTVVQKLRRQVPAATAGLGQGRLSAQQLAYHLCLLQPNTQQQHAELPITDTLTRCCLPDPTKWPADPMDYAAGEAEALTRTNTYMVTAGWVKEIVNGHVYYVSAAAAAAAQQALKRGQQGAGQGSAGVKKPRLDRQQE